MTILLSKVGKGERKTRLRTFRFSESLVRYLEKEAADEGTTVNALTNSIIGQHFNWDKKAKEFGFISIHKPIFMRLIEELDDEALARIGRETVSASYEEMADFWYQDSTPEKMLDALSTRFKYGTLMQAKITKEADGFTVVVRHDFGPKWSIVAENAARELCRKYFHVEPRISRGESVVTARFKVNPRNSPI